MFEESIPDDITQFILADIDSVALLEALLLLRANAHESWTVQAVAQRLYITDQETALLLAKLCEKRLLVLCSNQPLQYQYWPGSPELAQIVDQVAETYRKHLVWVTNLIHSKPQKRRRKLADSDQISREE